MSIIVKIGKLGKNVLRTVLPTPKPVLCPVRRIERVKTQKRLVAMTFDDGPMALPCSPDRFGGRSLTDVLLDTLARYDAHGTFDVIGTTAENYPDREGTVGSADWSGVAYDHYPRFGEDANGGALRQMHLIRRMLAEGHQITNHGYRHVLFGKKPFVYGKRKTLGSIDKVTDDLSSLHTLLQREVGYTMTMARPPHYVDRIGDGFTAYDAYERMNYQYLAASFDGAGWLPSAASSEEEALEAEVRAMLAPMESALQKDPDALCGQIIFQKDGCNMAKRTPVAFALEKQLALLRFYGYRVVTVEELLAESPFADVGRDDPDFEKLCKLSKTHTIVYSDNRLRLSDTMTVGELAMLLAPQKEAAARRDRFILSSKRASRCAGAMAWCREMNLIDDAVETDAVSSLPEGLFDPVTDFTRRSVYRAYKTGAEA